ncbi:hypothetical protein [uncultured Polaribacter sp.]|uniref:hypothetical protein n=1 Tax=uncultured Polaribacter sp. TaxID=174711 RepID=UPI0026143CA4|nr:hypothetical protein [uncultured Polaribacter sp.]
MKKLITLLFIMCTLFIKAQKPKTNITYSKNVVSKVTSLKYSTSLIKELETINWKDVKGVFESNNPKEKIELRFELDLLESKNKFKSSVAIGGETKELDSLIIRAKKLIKSIIKISENY